MKHGHTRHDGWQSPEYMAWRDMLQRCCNRSNLRWAEYGGRGITVCERWQEFPNFLADVGPRPLNHSLHRMDNNGNYEPSNVRWATRSEQLSNRRGRSRTFEQPYVERHREKVRAKQAVNNAIHRGKLSKEPCEVCGATRVEGHHADYSKPLEVRWLCKIHHEAVHHNKSGKSEAADLPF